jgi:hypothetical protein
MPWKHPCAALAIFLAFAPLALSQTSPRPRLSAPRTLILPPALVAGAPATLSVLDSGGRLLPSVVVDLEGGQKVTTDATGRALFKAPEQTGTFTAKVSNLAVSASAAIPSPNPSPSGSAQTPLPDLQISSYPRVLALRDRFTMEGAGFRVVADSNHVFLDNQPCVVLASSPISLVVLPGPRTPIGTLNLHVNVEGHDSGSHPVSVVLLDVSGPGATPIVGGQGQLTIHVHGATSPVAVEVRNASPKIIRFADGNVQRVNTSGGEQNIAQVNTTFLASGDYAVIARLLPTAAAPPNLEAVRKQLIAALAYATGGIRPQMDRLLELVDQDSPDNSAIAAQFKTLLDQKPLGQFGYLLNAAWQDFQSSN